VGDGRNSMRVGDARAVAARWVAEHAPEVPAFAGAFLSGSAAWLPADAELPATSDVDVLVVTAATPAPPKPGKLRFGGVLLEVTYLPADRLASPEQVLSTYYLAGSLRVDTVLADPTGRLGRLQAAVAGHFAERRWVRRRCQDAEARIVDGLGRLDRSRPLPAQALAWLFPTGVTTHVLLTAGLRNPTVRLRYLAVRGLLADYGRAGFHEELLALLGCRHLARRRVEEHLTAMTAVFDDAAAVARTPFPFASDVSVAARPIAVDGGRDLVVGGHHREAVFWIAATYARCLTILAADAPAATRARHEPGFEALLGDLGVADPAALGRRAREVLGFLLRQEAEAILAANPGIVD
jgi:hypothetical protein